MPSPKKRRERDDDIPLINRSVLRGLETIRRRAWPKPSKDIARALAWIDTLSEMQHNPAPDECEGPS